MATESDWISEVDVDPTFASASPVFPPEPVPSDLAGAVIVSLGSGHGASLEDAGLVIDYRPAGSDQVRRLALAFHEAGMWPTYSGPARPRARGRSRPARP